jgi:beta-mannosidase
LRQHPSVVLWCGGNELFNVWSGMTDQRKALRLLDRNCFDLDPDTPFLPTSPVMGVGHGDYRFRDEKGREVFQIFAASSHTAYTEFGCPGPASVEVLRSIIPAAELWPPRPSGAWKTHHAFGAWWAAPESWLFPSLVADYFGEQPDLESFVALAQLMQAEGYRCLFEEARRQKPRASMALNWCFNEPWPAAANNSLVSWPHRPKPALRAVGEACRPVLASARIPRFSWIEEDVFTAELFLLNDSPEPLPAGTVRASLRQDGRETLLCSWDFPAAPANRNLLGPVARAVLPAGRERLFELVLRVGGIQDADTTYRLCFRPGVRRKRLSPFVAPG